MRALWAADVGDGGHDFPGHAEPDTGADPSGVKVSDKQMVQLHLRRDEFHGEWNYEIHPGKLGQHGNVIC